MRKTIFDLNDKFFFTNFIPNGSKQQKNLVLLYVVQYDEKNSFLT